MISYTELYDVLRKEKYADTLQNLSKGFVSDYSIYVNDCRENTSKEGDLFMDSATKAKKQFENSISIFKELMLRRKKKILNLVFVAAETGIMKRDYENMLPFEREVFDRLVKAFEDGDKELSKMLSGKKEKEKGKFRMIMFSQEVEQFVDMSGGMLGPFVVGELANLNSEVAGILVSGGKASFVDED